MGWLFVWDCRELVVVFRVQPPGYGWAVVWCVSGVVGVVRGLVSVGRSGGLVQRPIGDLQAIRALRWFCACAQ